LLHEAWHPTAETADEIHSAAGEAARIAREADVTELMLIHVNPLLIGDQELLSAARSEFAATRVARDLDVLELP
jgi:ribonuclease BN (tRNA processing enzyme)